MLVCLSSNRSHTETWQVLIAAAPRSTKATVGAAMGVNATAVVRASKIRFDDSDEDSATPVAAAAAVASAVAAPAAKAAKVPTSVMTSSPGPSGKSAVKVKATRVKVGDAVEANVDHGPVQSKLLPEPVSVTSQQTKKNAKTVGAASRPPQPVQYDLGLV